MNIIDYIEELYQTVNIHRALIITDKNINKLKEKLLYNNHTPIIIDENSIIDYNYRLFLLSDLNLIDKFKKNSYNIIIIY
jgi:hypothetical protein